MNKKNFSEIFEEVLNLRLQKLIEQSINKKLDKLFCLSVYTLIFDTFTEILQESSFGISNDAANYFCQNYYDTIEINHGQILDPSVFDKRAKVEDISSKDLMVLFSLLKGTDLVVEIVKTLKSR